MIRRDEAAPYLSALATLLAAATLLPVVTGNGWAWQALFLVAVVVASGMGLRSLTRSPGLVVTGQAVVGLLGLTALFARSHAVLGFLPGPDALATMARLAQSGQQATRQFATPAPAVPGISFLLVLGVVAVAVAVDALAVTFGMAVAAGLPLLVLYCVPAAVLPHGASAVSFAMVAAGWLILLGHDGRLRVNEWGRVLRKGPESGRRRFGDDDLEVVGASARRLGIVTVAAAIVVPMLMPSLANGLIDPSHNGSQTGGRGGLGATSIDPTLTLRQNLTARSTSPVLTYRTTQAAPSPLRLVTDDQFNGETWESSDGRPSRSQNLSGTLPPPAGLSPGVSATPQQMHVRVSTLTEGYLPVPYPATKVSVKGSWVYAANSLDIVARGDTTKGLSYTVDYLNVQPTVAQLRGRTRPEPGHPRRLHPAPRLPAHVDPADGPADHGQGEHRVRQGGGAAGVVPHRRRLHVRHQRRHREERGRGQLVPHQQARVLRAVLLGHGGDGPAARHPGTHRRRVPARHPPVERQQLGQPERRPRVARALLRRGRVGPLRADPAGPVGRRAGLLRAGHGQRASGRVHRERDRHRRTRLQEPRDCRARTAHPWPEAPGQRARGATSSPGCRCAGGSSWRSCSWGCWSPRSRRCSPGADAAAGPRTRPLGPRRPGPS